MMNSADRQALTLVDIVDLKWLLAGEGHRVNVERMQRDAPYADTCLARAAQSPNAMVREAGERVALRLAAAAAVRASLA